MATCKDCRPFGGWLSADLECGIDCDPMCDYHHDLLHEGLDQHFRKTNRVVDGSGAGRSRFPPFNLVPAKVSRKSELKHVGLCLLVCLPVCTTVCLIVDRLIGG